MRKISGFTIIELVVVITILGILAAVALPKFIDVTVDAKKGASQGFAGAVASGSAINYGAYLAKGSSMGTGVQTVTTCDVAVLNTLLTAQIPTADYTITGTGVDTAGTSFTCTISAKDSGGTLVAGTGATATLIAVK